MSASGLLGPLFFVFLRCATFLSEPVKSKTMVYDNAIWMITIYVVVKSLIQNKFSILVLFVENIKLQS